MRALWLLAALAGLLALAAVGGIAFLDTQAGRDFAVRQLPLYAPKSGLTVRIGRIEGSLFGTAALHDVALGDPRGVFARAARVDLQWRPFDLFRNRLSIASLSSPEIDVLRRPELRPSADKRILPDIDIDIGKLDLPRVVLARPVTGTARLVGISGSADIVHGRAKILLAAAAPGAGDRLTLRLDAEPDRDRFDLDGHVAVPKGGVVDGLLGLGAPLTADLTGDGHWSAWRGHVGASLGDQPLLNLALTADAGRFTAGGRMMPARMLGGMAARMAGAGVRVDAAATLADRRAETRFTLRSAAVAATGAGGIDFGAETFSGLTLEMRVLQPAAMHPRLAARDLTGRARIGGSFGNPIVDYVVTAPSLTFGPTGFQQLRAVGIVQLGSRPLTVPVAASAARVTGFGPEADALLTNVRLIGPLIVRGGRLTGDTLVLSSDRASARATASLDLASGAYVATAKAAVPRYTLVGLGVADITADVRITPAGDKSRVAGTATVTLTRLDNKFFAGQLDGLPQVTAPIVLEPDGRLVFTAARLTSAGLALTASGVRTRDGIVTLDGSGTSRRYGPLTVRLAGPLTAPVVDLALARPGLGIGLANVAAHVVPAGGNWSFEARGGTTYGPVTARGLVHSGDPAPIDLAALTLAGITAHGSVVATPTGPLAGRLELGGNGIAGRVVLAAAGAVQRADVTATAVNARIDLGQPVAIGRGDLSATVLLPDAGPQVTGRFTAAAVRRADILITKASGTLDYRAGHGTARFDAAGLAQSPFTVAGNAALADNRLEISGGGSFNGRKIGIAAPAVLTRDGSDWVLAPATVTTPDGRAELSGRFGTRSALHARLQNLGLSLLTVASPTFDFGGRVSGTIDATLASGGLPAGTAALRVSGLSRAGLASASLPIDLGLNAQLGDGGGSARAVIVRAGVVEGRLQAQLRAIPAAGTMIERLLGATLVAQARYVGPAQALWPLAGIEAVDVKGPVTISADAGGTLGSPTLAGTIVSDGARVENVTLGTVVEKAHLDSRFTASRLELTSFSGTVGKGSVTGSGSIGLSADDGFPIDIRLALKDAAALKRDDLSATVTGDLHVVSGRDGGKISGKLSAERAKFRIGRPAQAEVPVLAVRETGTELVSHRIVPAERPTRWTLDIAVSAADRIAVEGMGLQSDWRGDLVIRGTPTAPELSGRVRLVRGDYDFAGKRFQLTRGDLRFTGGYPPDPVLDIAAENTQSSFTATLTITGTGLRPEIAFSSVPSLPQDEVLSRVLFGTSIASLSAPEALQLAGALTSLRGGKGDGLNPINLVRRKLGIDRLRILPANTTTGQKTAIAAGQYIGRRVYIELASDAQGYTASNIEVSLTRSLSILSQVATLGGTSASLRLKKDY